MDAEKILANLEQQLNEWSAVASDIKRQLSDLQQGQEELRIQIATISSSKQSNDLQSVSEAYQALGYESREALRRAIRAGHFKSGVEVFKLHGDSGPWRLDVGAIRTRLEKEQQLRRVC